PDGRSQLFIGKIEDYRRIATDSGFPDIFASETAQQEATSGTMASTAAPRPDYSDRKERKKARQKLESQIAKMESSMEQMRGRIATLNDELAATRPSDFSKLTALDAEKTGLEAELAALEEAWLAAAEELGSY